MVSIQETHGAPGTASPFTIARNVAEGLAPLTVASAGLALLGTELLRMLMAIASWLERKVRERNEAFREKMLEQGREEARKEMREWLRERGVDELPPWENGSGS